VKKILLLLEDGDAKTSYLRTTTCGPPVRVRTTRATAMKEILNISLYNPIWRVYSSVPAGVLY
jgi:hypothetical protein